jgi:hypothetical protein
MDFLYFKIFKIIFFVFWKIFLGFIKGHIIKETIYLNENYFEGEFILVDVVKSLNQIKSDGLLGLGR